MIEIGQGAADLEHGPLKENKQQAYRRLPFISRVTQRSSQTTYWRAVNISEGGIFVRAAPTLGVGTVVEIGFFLPGEQEEIVTAARVVWTNDANQPGFDPRKPYGMGMEFVDLREEFRGLIRAYIDAGGSVQGKE